MDEKNIQAFLYKRLINAYLKKIKSAYNPRIKASSKLIDIYGANGLNLNNMCNKIKTKGIIELAVKTASTFATFA